METISNSSTNINVSVSRDKETWPKILVATTMSPIIVLGCVGNILSLLVWVKIRRCRTSTACFLACLAAADSVALLTAGVNFWMSFVVGIDLKFTSSFACKFLVYIDFAAQFASAWIVVLVTIERAIAVCFPFKYKIACKPVTALGITLGTVFIMFCLCLVFPISADLISVPTRDNSSMDVCLFTNTSSLNLAESEWFYAELFIHFVIPFVIIAICNIIILVKTVLLVIQRWKNSVHARYSESNKSNIMKAIPIRAILLSVAFCVGVGPIHLYGYNDSLKGKLPDEVEKEVRENDGTDPVYLTYVIFMYLNNAINFLLYCVFGSSFRKNIENIFRRFAVSTTSSYLS